jgi:hypothetical protein
MQGENEIAVIKIKKSDVASGLRPDPEATTQAYVSADISPTNIESVDYYKINDKFLKVYAEESSKEKPKDWTDVHDIIKYAEDVKHTFSVYPFRSKLNGELILEKIDQENLKKATTNELRYSFAVGKKAISKVKSFVGE